MNREELTYRIENINNAYDVQEIVKYLDSSDKELTTLLFKQVIRKIDSQHYDASKMCKILKVKGFV